MEGRKKENKMEWDSVVCGYASQSGFASQCKFVFQNARREVTLLNFDLDDMFRLTLQSLCNLDMPKHIHAEPQKQHNKQFEIILPREAQHQS